MSEPSTTAKKPRFVFTARHAAIAGILGTLSLITTGMGLALPGYLPLVNFELTGTFLITATMAAGPLGGIIVTILTQLVSAVGMVGTPFFWPHILVFATFYPYIYEINKKNKILGVVLFWLVNALALFIQYWGWWWLYAAVFRLMTVEAMFWYNMLFGPYIVYLLIYALIPSIIFEITPEFVKPDWRFPYTWLWALISSIIAITLGALWWNKIGW